MAATIFSDVLPSQGLELHPDTEAILASFSEVSAPYLSQLPTTEADKLLPLGRPWARALCKAVIPFLPDPPEPEAEKSGEKERVPQSVIETIATGRLRHLTREKKTPTRIAPLKEPRPPVLDGHSTERNKLERLVSSLLHQKTLDFMDIEEGEGPIAGFFRAAFEAGRQHRRFEDMRSDVVAEQLRDAPFEPGPIEGSEVFGYSVTVHSGTKDRTGELFDQAAAVSPNEAEYDRIMRESEELVRCLRRNLYPNIERTPVSERFLASGRLDPARLALAGATEAVFKRSRIEELPDRRGRPVLLLACDGSASLSAQQMSMVKNLAAGWLQATTRTQVKVMAGLYHSGDVNGERNVPLVQWLYHPDKSPVGSRMEAIKALASLPAKGTGEQRDALSLAFMIDEARKVARGSVVYVVCLTDARFNKSFRYADDSPLEEVSDCFEGAYEEMSDKLNVTLVVLGGQAPASLKNTLDAVVSISPEELAEPDTVIERINSYVTDCMKERARRLGRRGAG